MTEKIDLDEFKMLLLSSEANPEYEGWDGFEKLIQGAINMNAREGYSKSFEEEYRALLDSGDSMKLVKKLEAHQMDNYILASFAAFMLKIPKDIPLVAWAAENKRLYEGWHGECVNLRALLLMGFNPNAQEPDDGNTALHAMCALSWGNGVHNKAIRYLLDSEADCNVQNKNGDTPLSYLAASYPWSKHVHQAFVAMLEGGADPSIKASDGKSALDNLKDNQASQDQSPARQSLIDALELMAYTPKARPSRTAARI